MFVRHDARCSSLFACAAFFGASLLIAPVAKAVETTIAYDIGSYANTGSTSLAPSVYDPALIVSEEQIPEPLTMQGLAPMNSGREGLFFARQWSNAFLPDPTKYFEFRLNLPGGMMTEPVSLSYAIGREAFSSNVGMNRWELHWSLDQFDEHDVTLAVIDSSSVADYFDENDLSGAMSVTTDLTSMGTLTSDVSFRWYASGGIGNPAAGFIDDRASAHDVVFMTENGVVPIPEPSLAGLTLVGLATLAWLGRRRRA